MTQTEGEANAKIAKTRSAFLLVDIRKLRRLRARSVGYQALYIIYVVAGLLFSSDSLSRWTGTENLTVDPTPNSARVLAEYILNSENAARQVRCLREAASPCLHRTTSLTVTVCQNSITNQASNSRAPLLHTVRFCTAPSLETLLKTPQDAVEQAGGPNSEGSRSAYQIATDAAVGGWLLC